MAEANPQDLQRSCFVSTVFSNTEPKTCIEIGVKANEKGNYRLARQMLHAAMDQLDDNDDKQPRLVELIACIADTYLNEGNYKLAKQWYMKALKRCEILQGANTVSAACLMAKLAQVEVLQSNIDEFKQHFENVQRAFLLTVEENISVLLGPLTDLSWALCVKKRIEEVQPVNNLIAQIKHLEEDKLEIEVA